MAHRKKKKSVGGPQSLSLSDSDDDDTSQSSSKTFSGFSSSDSESQNEGSVANEDSKHQHKLNNCGSCSRPLTNSDDQLNCGQCKFHFHLACTSFNRDVFSTLQKNNCFSDIIWHCTHCKAIASKSNHPFMKLLAQLEKQILSLEEQLKLHIKPMSIQATKSSNKVPLKKDTVTHQVIVTAKDTDTPETFADKIKKNLRSVPITNFKVNKDGNGVINFPSPTSRGDGLQKLQKDFSARANDRPQRSLLPKVTISGIDSNEYKKNDTTKLKKAICAKNPHLRTLIEKGNVFDIVLIEENYKQKRLSNAVVRVDEDVYKAIRDLKFQIFIDFSRCHVTDRFKIIQCYKCQKFGHLRMNCTSRTQVCRFCSKDHDSKSCNAKGNMAIYKCGNCSLNHSTTYYGCPVLQKQVEHLASRTLCMETFSKNDLRSNIVFT